MEEEQKKVTYSIHIDAPARSSKIEGIPDLTRIEDILIAIINNIPQYTLIKVVKNS